MNLGFALLGDCEHNDDKKNQLMLVQLLRQPSFVPHPVDFESFVTICLFKKTNLLLKTFLQSFQMQVIFTSFPLETQKRIMRLIMGLSPDGKEYIKPIFEPNITLKKPYCTIALMILLESAEKVQSPLKVAQQLLTSMTTMQLSTVAFMDRGLISSFVVQDDGSSEARSFKSTDKKLEAMMEKLINRITTESQEQGIKLD